MSFEKRSIFAISRKSTSLMDCLIFALLASVPSIGRSNDGVASNSVVHKAGLTVDWFTQSGIGAGGKIVDWTLNVNENKSTTYFALQAGNFREVISQNSLNAFGKPYGLDGAVAYIEVRKEIIEAEFKNDSKSDVKVDVDQYSLPETTIFTITDDGIIAAIDGDNGKTKWTTQIGDTRLANIGLGADDIRVAAVNGSTLYVLESVSGKVLWSRACDNAVGAPPAVSEEGIFVPLIDGRLQVFPTEKNGLATFSFVSHGSGSARPYVSETTISWPTATGDLNVAARFGIRSKAISYRLKADDAIVSSPSFKSGTLFVASRDGFVYAINEQRGSIFWEVSIGEGVTQSPIPIGDSVYSITDDGMLFRLDAQTGNLKWPNPLKNIRRYVGASKDHLYFTDLFGQLLVINPESGAILNRVEAGDIAYVLPNYETDRLYVGSHSGMIQCLREVGSKRPFFHSLEIAAVDPKAQPAESVAMPKEETVMPAATTEEDPFKPLGQAAQEPAVVVSPTVNDDPFASGDNASKSAAPASDPVTPDPPANSAEDDPFK